MLKKRCKNNLFFIFNLFDAYKLYYIKYISMIFIKKYLKFFLIFLFLLSCVSKTGVHLDPKKKSPRKNLSKSKYSIEDVGINIININNLSESEIDF